MAPLRSLLVLLILIGLVCAATAVAQAPVEWYTESSGGGAVAGPAPHNTGGGAVAPTTGDAPATVNLPPPTEMPKSDSPPAQAARAPVVKAPSAKASSDSSSGQAVQAIAAAQTAPAGDDRPLGSLPFTGLELAVIAAAGLCLLLAGFALRPARG
jgi:hypothetical protein